MSRTKLKEYQNTYAEQMAKYGLQRSIEGSEAKHVTTSQYYRDLLSQTESIQGNIGILLEQQEAAKAELSKVLADVSKEKLKNSAADVGATLLDGVGSLFGSSKTKQQQQKIEILEAENYNLTNDIKNLNTKVKTMETEHKTAIDRFSKQLNKIFSLFPHIKELMNFEGFCRKVGFGTEMIQRLFNRESVGFKGEIYSHEYHRKFSTSHSVAKIEPDPRQSQKFKLNIDGLEIYDWFRQKQKEFLHSIGIKPQEKQNGGMKL